MIFLQGDYNEIASQCSKLIMGEYFEFEFAYVSENTDFKEIDRFLWDSRHQCTRYKNRYNGPVIIGLNEWNSCAINKYFDAFMYFLRNYLRNGQQCVFFVEDKADKQLIEALGKHFDIEPKVLRLTKNSRTERAIGFSADTMEVNYVRS